MEYTSLTLSYLKHVFEIHPRTIAMAAMGAVFALCLTILLLWNHGNLFSFAQAHRERHEAKSQTSFCESTRNHGDLGNEECGTRASLRHSLRHPESGRLGINNLSSPPTGSPAQPENTGIATAPSVQTFVPKCFDHVFTNGEGTACRTRRLNQPLPIYVPCSVQILLNGQLFKRCDAFNITWQTPSEFTACVNMAEQSLKSSLKDHHAGSLYKFYKVCHQYRIVKAPQDDFFKQNNGLDLSTILSIYDRLDQVSSNLMAQERNMSLSLVCVEDVPVLDDWAQRVPRKLAPYLLDEPQTVFAIEMRLFYTTYRLHTTTCSSLRCLEAISNDLLPRKVSIKDEYGNEVNWFVPSRFLSAYFDRALIEHLVAKQTWSRICGATNDLATVAKEKEKFVHDIHLNGVHLLATTIYAGLDLSFLYKLWKAGKRDQDMPLDQQCAPDGTKPRLFSDFRDHQHRFKAHIFPDSQELKASKHRDIIPGQRIVPITYKKKRGHGANGTVYEIRIHEDHHNFTPNRNEGLAMKTLYYPEESNPDEESEVLQTLAEVPHDHLTPFYASWWHANSYGVKSFHMLFPLAECDLYTFLMNTPSPTLDGPNYITKMTWLISQMLGLAAALNHIHNLAPAGLGPYGNKNGTNRPRTGVHLDLSLKNVLIFSGNIMKISDFGTAKIRQIMSGDTRFGGSPGILNPPGNLAYAAPDGDLGKRVSRPHDIWSLGCIFLEILLWASGSGSNPETFSNERAQSEDQLSPWTSAFYYVNGSQSGLKRCVRERLQLLDDWVRKQAETRNSFSDVWKFLVIEVNLMLQTNMEERPIAASVQSILAHLLLQAQLDSSTPHAPSKPRFAPPSTVGGQTVCIPSHQTKQDGEAYHALLSPQGPTFRSRSGSRSTIGSRRNSLAAPSQWSPHLPPSGTSVVHSGAGADASDTTIDAPPLRIQITDHGTASIVEGSATPTSAALQRLQDAVRPARPRNNSDPRRIQTMP